MSWSASQCLNFGGRDVSQYIERHYLEASLGVHITSLAELTVVDTIKHECCVCGIPDEDVVSSPSRHPACTSPLSLSLFPYTATTMSPCTRPHLLPALPC